MEKAGIELVGRSGGGGIGGQGKHSGGRDSTTGKRSGRGGANGRASKKESQPAEVVRNKIIGRQKVRELGKSAEPKKEVS